MLRTLFQYLGKQQLYPAQSPEAGNGQPQITVLEATDSFNRPEGAVVAPSRLKAQVVRNVTPKSRSEQKIAGYRNAPAWISSRLMLRAMKSEGMTESMGEWLGAKWIQVPVEGEN